ncbi:hypothetical protein GCM10009764_21300 [Nocardia ninae]|uniref:Uncharacterized protein n=1 Tax=Nocardia ninae NBRC 108245 TaxID=1210091 RepID=A0A511MTL3_9NOCA|nr:hypothetical protein NN4_84480 [Nocardia ninae NBRC 108245]
MRLGNGAINCAGQGHNEAAVGLDRTRMVCITLCQNRLTPRTVPVPAPHLSWQCVRDPGGARPICYQRPARREPRLPVRSGNYYAP